MRRVKVLAVGAAALAVTGCGGTVNEPDQAQTTSPSVHRDREYAGVGSQIIGALTFPKGADATWTSTPGLFMLIAINAPASAQLIVSKAASGTDRVPAGSYVLKVGTLPTSKWTLRFHER